MVNYKIEFDRKACIGAAACVAVCPDNWQLAKDGKANVRKKDIDEKNFEKNMEAAKMCPVNCIHIIRKDTKEKLI